MLLNLMGISSYSYRATAMGTKMALAYTNLFMGSIETTFQNIDWENIYIRKRYMMIFLSSGMDQ